MKTERQWNDLGYILNDDAVGELQWNNCYYRYKVMRYSEEEVHQDIEKAKEIVKKRQREYKKRYQEEQKRKEEKLMEFCEWRSNWGTAYQWENEGRQPKENAKWYEGKRLNYLYKLDGPGQFGDNYYYCHFDETEII